MDLGFGGDQWSQKLPPDSRLQSPVCRWQGRIVKDERTASHFAASARDHAQRGAGWGEYYSEATNDRGTPRSHWRGVYEFLERLPAGEFDQRVSRADELLRENGVTFNIFAEDPAASATLRLDLLPLVQPADEWRALEAALCPRRKCSNSRCAISTARKRCCTSGVLPPEAVLRHPGFFRTLHNLRGEDEQRITLYAAELRAPPVVSGG